MSLSNRVKDALSHANMSASELAKKIKTRPSTISDWITGSTKTMSSKHGFAAAMSLGVSPEWLINGDGDMLTGVATPDQKAFIFECLKYIVSIEPDIDNSRLLTVGSMLYNSCKHNMIIDKSEAKKLLSIVD